jgi:hypothetical protein
MPEETQDLSTLKKEELVALATRLRADNAALQARVLTPAEDEAVIEKVRLGLTRDQALEVIKAQREWDAHPDHPDNVAKRVAAEKAAKPAAEAVTKK